MTNSLEQPLSDKLSSVLIVDDSPSDIQVLLTNLQDGFKLAVAKSGEKALELVQEIQPNVVLMDVAMPGMDGHETCAQIKAMAVGANIEVIFVSANDTVEEKLKGYDAGAADYLIKPVEPDELRRKVNFAIKRQLVEYDRRNAYDTAMLAMTDSGEQGLILDFLRKSFSVANLHGLADLLAASVARFGLACSVQIRDAEHNFNVSNTGPILPLEIELMGRLADTGRIHQKHKRLIINFTNLSMLVKNMPEDEITAGRVRDHLMVMAEAASNQVAGLSLTESFHDLIEHSNQVLDQIKHDQAAVKQRNVEILDQMLLKVEDSFSTVGLTHTQEEDLLTIIKDSIELSLDNFEQGLTVDARMDQIAAEVDQVVQLHKQGLNPL